MLTSCLDAQNSDAGFPKSHHYAGEPCMTSPRDIAWLLRLQSKELETKGCGSDSIRPLGLG
eukprot:6014508-Amphidinium_carterae.1